MRSTDLALLLPTFRSRVELMLADLRDAGHLPVVMETLRSPERARMLARRGTGSPRSMHIYGAAVDVICQSHRWGCYRNKCDFFEQLGSLAKRHGMHWGGDWRSRDCPHVQAIPVCQQRAFVALSERERDEWLRRQ